MGLCLYEWLVLVGDWFAMFGLDELAREVWSVFIVQGTSFLGPRFMGFRFMGSRYMGSMYIG